jgi:hypothetical protein
MGKGSLEMIAAQAASSRSDVRRSERPETATAGSG